MSKVTIYDVAQEAEVGIGTVSRVLNDSEKVREKTRKKVLKAMRKLNYRPNAMARGLALQKTDSIGVIVPHFTNHFFVEVLWGVQLALQEFEMDLILFNVSDKTHKEKYIDRILKEKRVDGVLAITMDITKEEVNKFSDANLPLVLVDDFQEGVSSIFVDDIVGTKKAIEYLVESGHERIAFFNGALDSRQGADRLRGVKLALKRFGLDLRPELLKIGDFTEGSGYEQMKEIIALDSNKRPTAIFTASDNQALGALELIEEEQLSVPDDFCLIGYDDIELARYLKLTTVSQPMREMGKLGINTLITEICSNKNSKIKKILEPDLVIRESC